MASIIMSIFRRKFKKDQNGLTKHQSVPSKCFLQDVRIQNGTNNYKFKIFQIFLKISVDIWKDVLYYNQAVGNTTETQEMQEWRNWQTRRLQVPVVARSCGFKSHLLHYFFSFVTNTRAICSVSHGCTEFY